MDTSFLQGAGLFMCVAGIVMVVLLVLAVRAFTSAAKRNKTGNQDVFNERGRERPTYDSERVESRGGFGSEGGSTSIPQTGRTADPDRNRVRAYDSDRQPGDPLPRLDNEVDDVNLRRRDKRNDDDDDVRSSGGFGT